ncbi:MAG: methyl-accepting chemotaxis protein [Syntrophobacter sp.]
MKKLSFTLGAKLTIGGVLFTLVPILVVGIPTIFQSTTALEASAKREVLAVSRGVAKAVQLNLSEKLQLAQQLAGENAVVATARETSEGDGANAAREVEKLNQRLTSVMKQLGSDYEGVFLVDRRGIIRADGIGGSMAGLDVSERSYFKTSKEGKASISDVVNSKNIGEAVVPAAAPVKSQTGEFLGVVVISIKMSYFTREVTDVELGKTGYAYLVNTAGLVVAHAKKDLVLSNNITTNAGMETISRKALARQSGNEAYTFQGKEKVAGFAPVEIAGWSAIATQDADEVLAPAHSMRNGILLSGLIQVSISLLIVLGFSRRISKPISNVVTGLSGAAERITASAAQVASAGRELAEGASEQASAIEETSSSLEEMSSMTRQNAGNANQANRLMSETREIVARANEAMTNLAGSMEEISKASEDTQKIVKSIDEIAFQTNLLALNAAVEAARAGQAGAGFAVVADEVRNLAMRAAEAAKNTAELIEGTVRKIRDGSEMVGRTNAEFSRVAQSTSKMGDLVSEIAAASNEQSQGMGQVNRAVGEMDKVVQRNASSAEETASASEEMNTQAGMMHGFVGELVALVGGNDRSDAKARELPATVSTRNDRYASTRELPAKGNDSARKALPGGRGEFEMETDQDRQF